MRSVKNKHNRWSSLFGGSPAGNWYERNYKSIVFIFFALFLVLGLSIYRDYGASVDETHSRENGIVTMGYVLQKVDPPFYRAHFGGVPDMRNYTDRDYGVLFEAPAVAITYLFGITADRDIFFLHHILSFLVFFIGVIFFYRMVKQRFNSWKIGLLGAIMLIVSPRIFAQSFYNSKDVVFMSLFLIAIYTLLCFLKQSNRKTAIWHALACAAAIDVRIMGILLPLITLGIVAIEIIKAPDIKQAFIKWGKLLAIYGVVLIFTVIACWPYLWASPVGHFITAFHNMSKFRWPATMLFMGKIITPAVYIPWYYIPVWIVISTPIVYSLLFLTGTVVVLKDVIKAKLKLYHTENSRSNLLFLLLFFGPLLAIIALKSVLYDAWRQLYFIYPAFLLLALVGFVRLYRLVLKRAVFKYAFIAIIAISIGFTTAFMVRNHPFEDVYFSCLPDDVAAKNFERDYWGLAFRKGLEYVAAHDTSAKIVVGYSPFATQNQLMLKPYDEHRIRVQDSTETSPAWIISNYRWDTKPHYNYHDYSKEVYSISVGHLKILSVFKLK